MRSALLLLLLLRWTIPTTIGELIHLQAVDVSNNPDLGADGCCDNADSYYSSFYGYNTTLPTEIGLLKKLQVLKMDWSRFMRHMPTEMGKLRSLQTWRLQGNYETNQVSGTIPTEVGSLKKLTEFMMENNTLSGTIPSELGLVQFASGLLLSRNGRDLHISFGEQDCEARRATVPLAAVLADVSIAAATRSPGALTSELLA